METELKHETYRTGSSPASIFLNARLPSMGFVLLSSMTNSIFLPSIPPQELISSASKEHAVPDGFSRLGSRTGKREDSSYFDRSFSLCSQDKENCNSRNNDCPRPPIRLQVLVRFFIILAPRFSLLVARYSSPRYWLLVARWFPCALSLKPYAFNTRY